MTQWMRFERSNGTVGFGQVRGDEIAVHEGDMFGESRATGETLPWGEVTVLPPTRPGKMLALWNNFHQLAAKLELTPPDEPLYFMKADNCYHGHDQPIRKPANYDGKVVFEGELGIVIGKRTKGVSEAEAPAHIFGYTCINDVTAIGLLNKDPSFQQWTRCKSFDTFGVMGPVVATGLDPDGLTIRTELDGTERQNYPVSDMFFRPHRLVSLISQDITLEAGDVICCGTSVGVGSMKPGSVVEVTIEGIGTLRNRFE